MFDQLQIDKDVRVELQIPPSAKLNFKLNDEKLRREENYVTYLPKTK
jgi:hypothetical protein